MSTQDSPCRVPLIKQLVGVALVLFLMPVSADDKTFDHRLRPVTNQRPILADHPRYVAPVEEVRRFEVGRLIDDPGADLEVDSWRFSYNARGIIEIPNRLAGRKTAVMVVHPWAIDDGQGWITPEPAGVAFGCTPEKNQVMLEHAQAVLSPLLDRLRPHVRLVMYSLPGNEDSIRKKIYRSFASKVDAASREEGLEELKQKLTSFRYEGDAVPEQFALAQDKPAAVSYFEQLPGLVAYEKYNPKGFWDLPIPVMKPINVALDDVVVYDRQGYPALRDFLKKEGVEHVLLCGYHADMCVCSTTAGYENLRNDFDVILVGDAVQASLPANKDARHSTNHAVATAALKVLITQSSWIRSAKDVTSRR